MEGTCSREERKQSGDSRHFNFPFRHLINIWREVPDVVWLCRWPVPGLPASRILHAAPKGMATFPCRPAPVTARPVGTSLVVAGMMGMWRMEAGGGTSRRGAVGDAGLKSTEESHRATTGLSGTSRRQQRVWARKTNEKRPNHSEMEWAVECDFYVR